VNAHGHALLHGLADAPLVRQAVDAVFRAHARRALARFERQDAGRAQLRTLLGLVHRARRTRFGRDHDFHRVRTEADFRRLVPPRTPAELHRLYWQAAFPRLDGATWPGPLPHLETFADAPGRPTRSLAVSPPLWAARRAALHTALGLVAAARPQSRLLSGRLVFLGGGAANAGLPPLVRPYAAPPGDADGAAAGRLLREPVTCLAGSAERILSFADQIRCLSGRGRLRDVWPGLSAVLYACRGPGGERARLREAAGCGVLLLEAVLPPEGPVAVEDPLRSGLRLLTNHGVYFEFTPAAEAGRPNAARCGVGGVEAGVDYEVLLTSPAGVWACRTGLAVRFEGRDPPRLHLAAPPAPAAPVTAPPALQAPHRRIAGTPAAPPGTFAHTPWSAPADRG
jgi:hypothetical protein